MSHRYMCCLASVKEALRGVQKGHPLSLKRLQTSLSTRSRGKKVGPNQLSHQLGVTT